MDMLAGKRAEVGTKLGAYMRTFSGDCSPSDLETALQVRLLDINGVQHFVFFSSMVSNMRYGTLHESIYCVSFFVFCFPICNC